MHREVYLLSGIISKLGSELVDLVFPVPCIGCGTYGVGPLCAGCKTRIISHHREIELLRIGYDEGKSRFIEIKSAGVYEGTLKKMILELKASFSVYAAPLALLMMSGAGNDPGYLIADQVYCVPSTREKIAERGYNPARLLAGYVSAHLGVPLVDALAKTRNTDDQDSLGERERWSNVEGAFRVVEGFAPVDRAILVDDVLTTGATSINCARALISAGAGNIMVLVAGRAQLRECRNYQ